MLFDWREEVTDIKEVKSLKLNVDQTGFYRVYYDRLYDKVWSNDLSEFDRWGIVSDALAFLASGKLSFSEYLSILSRYYDEEGYLPAFEVSDQLAFLYSIMPSSVTEVSREFHRSQLKILDPKTDENSLMLKSIMAGRLAMIDENYAKELGAEFHEYERVEPDMRLAVAIAFARGYGDLEKVTRRYMESESDEERTELLSAMMSFKEASLVALSLGFALSGKVKRQDVAAMITSAVRNPEAKNVAWIWLKVNIEALKRLYEGTGRLSRVLQTAIPILGIGRVGEVEKFFADNEIPGAGKGIEVGLERLQIYDKLVKAVQ
jgi:tricorn protease interacting factor F2/3